MVSCIKDWQRRYMVSVQVDWVDRRGGRQLVTMVLGDMESSLTINW